MGGCWGSTEGKLGKGSCLMTVGDQVSLSVKDSDHGLVLCSLQTSEHQSKGALATALPQATYGVN